MGRREVAQGKSCVLFRFKRMERRNSEGARLEEFILYFNFYFFCVKKLLIKICTEINPFRSRARV